MALQRATSGGSFHWAAIGLASAAMIGLSSFAGAFPAAAEQGTKPFTPQQCLDAMKIIDGVTDGYRGRLSHEFTHSLVGYGRFGCDSKYEITRMPGFDDERAYAEIRLHLIAFKSGLR